MPLPGRVKLFSQTEVTEFDLALIRDQNVAPLQIPMQVLVPVQVSETLENLLQDTLELRGAPLHLVVDKACQVMWHKLEN